MIIYRYLTSEEVINFIKGHTRQLGARPTAKNLEISKKYKPDQRYVHFFKNIDDLPRIQKLDRDPKGKYVGMFDLPRRFVISGDGVGEYAGMIQGGDETPIKEFAVEVRALRLAEFIDYVYDENCDLSVDEVRAQFEELGQEPGEKD